jgi:hypothetical protein
MLSLICDQVSAQEMIWQSSTRVWAGGAKPGFCNTHCLAIETVETNNIGLAFYLNPSDQIAVNIYSELASGFQLHYHQPTNSLLVVKNQRIRAVIKLNEMNVNSINKGTLLSSIDFILEY